MTQSIQDTVQELQVSVKKAEVICSNITSQGITSPESLTAASEFLARVKDKLKSIESMRDYFVRPLNNQVKDINNMFKMQSEPFVIMEKLIKGEIVKYHEEQERIAMDAEIKRREEEEKLRAKLEAAKTEKQKDKLEQKIEAVQVPVAAPQQTIRTNAGVVSVKKVWTFKITDQSLVPDEFWEINETMIRKEIAAGNRDIPGVNIYQESQIASR
jgi:hypothetical protein